MESSAVAVIHNDRTGAKKSSRLKTFFVRCVIAVAVIGVILAVHYIQAPTFSSIKDVLHDVFCYDFFGRTGFGTSVFFA